MKRKNNYLPVLFAAIALSTALLGHSGLWNYLTRDPYREVKLETYRVIEAAQYYYLRPKSHGGGGRSFEGMSLDKLNVFDEESGAAKYRLSNVREHLFDLLVTTADGEVFEARNLGFDTRPELLRTVK